MEIVTNGMNPNYSRGVFGAGCYFAELSSKVDQYVTPDFEYDSHKMLHTHLFSNEFSHPGSIFYLLVCRVALGHTVYTRTATNPVSIDTGEPIFPSGMDRELGHVPGSNPPVNYHSLQVELGETITRHREWVVFHHDFIYPEYLVAYQRFQGDTLVQISPTDTAG
eukprot:980209-Prymnesium_polylepis.1